MTNQRTRRGLVAASALGVLGSAINAMPLNGAYQTKSTASASNTDPPMKLRCLPLVLLAAATLSTGARANSMAANIANIWQLSGKVYITMSSIQWDGPQTTCTPATPMFMVDPNTAAGRAQLSLLIVAKEAGHRVYLVGDGACVGGGPNGWLAESLNGLQLQP